MLRAATSCGLACFGFSLVLYFNLTCGVGSLDHDYEETVSNHEEAFSATELRTGGPVGAGQCEC